MTEFEDEAIVLSARSHGEGGAIVHVLSQSHGHVAAHVAGGVSRRLKPYLQPGSHVQFSFRARSAEHLGAATIEGISVGGAELLDRPLGLLGLQSAAIMTHTALSEREAHPGLYQALTALIGLLEADVIWPYVYVRYEMGLLQALGFGIDLSTCAVSGSMDDLVYVSKKSARAVSAEAGAPYKDKLLLLPSFLRPGGTMEAGDIELGLDLTGYFFERHVYHPLGKPLPEVRQRLRQQDFT